MHKSLKWWSPPFNLYNKFKINHSSSRLMAFYEHTKLQLQVNQSMEKLASFQGAGKLFSLPAFIAFPTFAWFCTFKNYLLYFLCLFMLMYESSCSSLFQHCIQSLWWRTKKDGKSTCGFLFHHHHFPSDSPYGCWQRDFLFLSSLASVFRFFGINIHIPTFVWCYSYLLLPLSILTGFSLTEKCHH